MFKRFAHEWRASTSMVGGRAELKVPTRKRLGGGKVMTYTQKVVW